MLLDRQGGVLSLDAWTTHNNQSLHRRLCLSFARPSWKARKCATSRPLTTPTSSGRAGCSMATCARCPYLRRRASARRPPAGRTAATRLPLPRERRARRRQQASWRRGSSMRRSTSTATTSPASRTCWCCRATRTLRTRIWARRWCWRRWQWLCRGSSTPVTALLGRPYRVARRCRQSSGARTVRVLSARSRQRFRLLCSPRALPTLSTSSLPSTSSCRAAASWLPSPLSRPPMSLARATIPSG